MRYRAPNFLKILKKVLIQVIIRHVSKLERKSRKEVEQDKNNTTYASHATTCALEETSATHVTNGVFSFANNDWVDGGESDYSLRRR